MTDLHPRIAEVVDELERAHADFTAFIATIPTEQRDAPADGDRWSVAQIVEHLAIVEDGVGRLISKLIKQVEASGVAETEDSSMLATMAPFSIHTVVKRINAPESVQPVNAATVAESLARLDAARARMIDAYRRASGLALASVLAPHPAVGPLNVYQWGHMSAQHQRRHMTQIRTVVASSEP